MMSNLFMFFCLLNMHILNNRLNNTYFKSHTHIQPDESMDDAYFQDCRNVLREHYYNEELPFHKIYENQGKMTDYQFGNLVKNLAVSPKHINENEVLSLPLKNIRRIDGTKNSYRGQTLCFAKNKYLETIKNSGVTTVVDLVGYFDYDTKVKNAGMNYHLFKINHLYDSPACSSLKEHLNRNERLLNYAKNDGIDIDIEKQLKLDKELFLEKTRDGVSNFVKFINIMSGDNVYIGGEYGTRDTDEALMWNEAFNPKFKDKPLNIDKMGLLNNMYNLYYNLTPKDKFDMGWTKDVEDKFIGRMTDCQMKLFAKQG